jgi:PAS domain-containing protein
MHALAQFFSYLTKPLVFLSVLLTPQFFSVVRDADDAFAMAAIVLSAGLVVTASAFWSVRQRTIITRLQGDLRVAAWEARCSMRFRDTLLTSGWDGIATLGSDTNAINFGAGSLLLRACLAGPDAGALAKAVDELVREGASFERICRRAEGRPIHLLGRSLGSRAVVFSREAIRRDDRETDYRALVDALPLPLWTRDARGQLVWANEAFLAATGNTSLDEAREKSSVIERTELDLFGNADEGTVRAKRFAAIGGERRALELCISPLGRDSCAAMAIDITDAVRAESKLAIDIEAQRDVLDQLPVAVAVFDAERRLMSANKQFVRQFGRSERWIETKPSFDELLESLRADGRLPEQRDFNAWKREMGNLFEDPRVRREETWHLPNGRSERIVSTPHPLGGLTFVFEDLTNEFELRSAYNALVKVQKATLDTIDEALCVFGPDGRLKLHNEAFARLWRLDDGELVNGPHVKQVADACAKRIGQDEAWSIVTAAINAADPERYNAWSTIKRGDGRVIAISLTRLPDGSTMSAFSDMTDYIRLENNLKSGLRAA